MKLHKSSFGKRFAYAFDGIFNSIKSETNFRVHFAAAITAIALSWLFAISMNEWLWVLFAIFFVFVTEVMNTAIESLSNLVSPEYHPLIKKTKDASAGAVLLSAIFSLICGMVIFLPKFIEFLF